MAIELLKITSKNVVRDALIMEVYKGFYGYFNKELEQLAQRNCSMLMLKHKSFVFRGEHFLFEHIYANQRIRNQLHPSLKPLVEALIEERKDVEWKERPYVMNYFATLLSTGDCIGNYYALLPEYLHFVLNNLGLKNSDTTFSKEYIEAFYQTQKHPISLIQQRRMWDLIQ